MQNCEKYSFFQKQKYNIFYKKIMVTISSSRDAYYERPQPPSLKSLQRVKEQNQFISNQLGFFNHLKNFEELSLLASREIDFYFQSQKKYSQKKAFIEHVRWKVHEFLEGLEDIDYYKKYKKREEINAIEKEYLHLLYFGTSSHPEALRRKRLEKMHHFFPLYDQEPHGIIENIKDFIGNILAKK